jgi:AcrR family transcriptional regulator
MSSEKRKYELRQRAAGMEETRRRITEAAMELHGSVGPARTTVTAVAERAGVQRHTVYRHFPTDDDLYTACSGLWAERFPWPDLDGWRAIEDPAARLETGLDELYGWYERVGAMLANLYRDGPVVPAVADQMVPMTDFLAGAERTLAAPWGRGRLVTAAVRHVADFHTWRSLTGDGGLSRAEAVRLARAMVEGAATRTRGAAARAGAASSRPRAASHRG